MWALTSAIPQNVTGKRLVEVEGLVAARIASPTHAGPLAVELWERTSGLPRVERRACGMDGT